MHEIISYDAIQHSDVVCPGFTHGFTHGIMVVLVPARTIAGLVYLRFDVIQSMSRPSQEPPLLVAEPFSRSVACNLQAGRNWQEVGLV